MRMRLLGWLAGGLGSTALAAGAALPGEVTVIVPTRLELSANGKSGGSIGLRAGEKLTVVGATDAYGKIRALYPEFEVVHVNRDKSPADMVAYMRDDRMPWPALEWSAIRGTREITRYAGSGIPCLVLIDADGKVLSDSYRWGRYVGPDAVLEDTWKILRDYRRAHPRPKT